VSERVDVCNLALGWLGANLITSIEDDADEARLCKVNYIPARDATLEAHPWSFAIKRFIPAKLEGDSVYGQLSRFKIPSDIMRVLRVDREEGTWMLPYWGTTEAPEQANWVLEGDEILAPLDVVYCRGIRRIEDEGIYSPTFVQAFSAHMAMLMALSLTQSQSIFQDMAALYAEKLREARSRDGLQGRSRRIRNRTMHRSRAGRNRW
jgi:hypothetical protein